MINSTFVLIRRPFNVVFSGGAGSSGIGGGGACGSGTGGSGSGSGSDGGGMEGAASTDACLETVKWK